MTHQPTPKPTGGHEHEREPGLERRARQRPEGGEVLVVVPAHVETVATHAVFDGFCDGFGCVCGGVS